MREKKITCCVCGKEWNAEKDYLVHYEQCESCNKYFCKPKCGFQDRDLENWFCDKCTGLKNQ